MFICYLQTYKSPFGKYKPVVQTFLSTYCWQIIFMYPKMGTNPQFWKPRSKNLRIISTWQVAGGVVVGSVVLDEWGDRWDVAGVQRRHARSAAHGRGLVVKVQHPTDTERLRLKTLISYISQPRSREVKKKTWKRRERIWTQKESGVKGGSSSWWILICP